MVAAANNPASCIGRGINYLWAELCAKPIHLCSGLKQDQKIDAPPTLKCVV